MSNMVTIDPFMTGHASKIIDFTDSAVPLGPGTNSQLFDPGASGRVDVLSIACNLYMFNIAATIQEVHFDVFFLPSTFRVFHGGMLNVPPGAAAVSRSDYPERSVNFQGPIGETLNFVWDKTGAGAIATFYGTLIVQVILRKLD